MTGKPLFAYGTLRDPDVLAALLGRMLTGDDRLDAHAPGFAAVHYPQRAYPALIEAATGDAPGLLLQGLTPIEFAILDAFEGEEYRRATITVATALRTIHADVYLPVMAIAADAQPWTLASWTQLHKPSVLDGERRTAMTLRHCLGTSPNRPPR